MNSVHLVKHFNGNGTDGCHTYKCSLCVEHSFARLIYIAHEQKNTTDGLPIWLPRQTFAHFYIHSRFHCWLGSVFFTSHFVKLHLCVVFSSFFGFFHSKWPAMKTCMPNSLLISNSMFKIVFLPHILNYYGVDNRID